MEAVIENQDARAEALEKRVSLIAARMTMREPFIAAVFAKAKRKFEPGITGATDGATVWFGIEFCEKLTDKELFVLALHEAMHIIWLHMWRRGLRDARKFNVAADAVINRQIKEMGYEFTGELANGVFLDWVTSEMNTEEVYAKLPDPPPEDQPGQPGNEQGQGGDSNTDGDPCDDGDGQNESGSGSSPDPADLQKPYNAGGFDGKGDIIENPSSVDEADMAVAIQTAAKMAKACGTGGALVDKVLDASGESTVPWSDTVKTIITELARDDYTYRKFHKAMYQAARVVTPKLWNETCGGLLLIVDSSASVSQQELNQIAVEINAVFEDCRPSFVDVLYCDTCVKGEPEHFDQGDLIELHAKGGGGTAFRPAFQYLEDSQEKYAAVIYFTDMWGNAEECADLEPECPVIWAATCPVGYNRVEVPFGEKVLVQV